MADWNVLREKLASGGLDGRIKEVYGCKDAAQKRERLALVMDKYQENFGTKRGVGLFSGPGRVELGGNHTDHQHGHVIAAAVSLDTIACAGENGTNVIRVISEGYNAVEVDLTKLSPESSEFGTSVALVKGVVAYLSALGYNIRGFDAAVSSDVPAGSGLSSSAAYEVLMGIILNSLFCENALTATDIAKAGQYAENVYFGKPCGLMDQLTSAVGGAVAIDFFDADKPLVRRINCDLASYGYALAIVDSGASHADLTGSYAAIPDEMRAVARYFGKEYLREVDGSEFWQNIPKIRALTGDRAILRAIHFFDEDKSAILEADNLEKGDFVSFLDIVRSSGISSARYLQNLSCAERPKEQAIAVTIAAAEHILGSRGAVRVHGGGFAGTVLAFVPLNMMEDFRTEMEKIIGVGCCRFLSIRPTGGTVIA